MNLKARHEFEQRHLEAEFRQSKNSEPRLWHGKTDVDFSLPNFFLNDFEFVSKSYDHSTEPPLS
jgi:hypothetical protein